MDTIIVSEYHIVNGVFMARSFHKDLTKHQMLFDEDRKIVVNRMGTLVNYITEHAPNDKFIVNNYGEDVYLALINYIARKK